MTGENILIKGRLRAWLKYVWNDEALGEKIFGGIFVLVGGGVLFLLIMVIIGAITGPTTSEKCHKDCSYLGNDAVVQCVRDDWDIEDRKNICLWPGMRDKYLKNRGIK
jgi:hypothetical protein